MTGTRPAATLRALDPPPAVDHLAVILVGSDPDRVAGLTEADASRGAGLVGRPGPWGLWRLVEVARNAGLAVLIRSDLPPID